MIVYRYQHADPRGGNQDENKCHVSAPLSVRPQHCAEQDGSFCSSSLNVHNWPGARTLLLMQWLWYASLQKLNFSET